MSDITNEIKCNKAQTDRLVEKYNKRYPRQFTAWTRDFPYDNFLHVEAAKKNMEVMETNLLGAAEYHEGLDAKTMNDYLERYLKGEKHPRLQRKYAIAAGTILIGTQEMFIIILTRSPQDG